MFNEPTPKHPKGSNNGDLIGLVIFGSIIDSVLFQGVFTDVYRTTPYYYMPISIVISSFAIFRLIHDMLSKTLRRSRILYVLAVFLTSITGLILAFGNLYLKYGIIDPQYSDKIIYNGRSSIYLSFMAILTVGGGDVVPAIGVSRVTYAIETLYGYLIFGLFLTSIPTLIIRWKENIGFGTPKNDIQPPDDSPINYQI